MGVKRMNYCINGEWVPSKTDKYMPITDSSTGEVIAEVPSCTKGRGFGCNCLCPGSFSCLERIVYFQENPVYVYLERCSD